MREPYLLTTQDTNDVLAVPAVAAMPELAPVAALARSGGGCRGCRRGRARGPGWLAPSAGAALNRAIKAGRGRELYKALAAKYSIKGPIKLKIGTCAAILQDE